MNEATKFNSILNGACERIRLGMQRLLEKTQNLHIDLDYSNLEKVDTCVLELLKMINDFVDFVGQKRTVTTTFTLEKLWRQVVSATSQLSSRNQTLQLEHHISLSQNIQTDKHKLIQILVNLISNASKYSAENSKISVNIHTQNSTLFFSVEDEGVGIHPKYLRTIFEEYRNRVDDNEVSLGLGLAITRKLVASLGGEIAVESVLGKGSKFYGKIQLLELSMDSVSSSKMVRLMGKSVKFLLVDCVEYRRSEIAKILLDVDYVPVIAASSSEAMRYQSILPHFRCIFVQTTAENYQFCLTVKNQMDPHAKIIGIAEDSQKISDEEQKKFYGLLDEILLEVSPSAIREVVLKTLNLKRQENQNEENEKEIEETQTLSPNSYSISLSEYDSTTRKPVDKKPPYF